MSKNKKAIGFCRVTNRQFQSPAKALVSVEAQIGDILSTSKKANLEISEWFLGVGRKERQTDERSLVQAYDYCKANPSVKTLYVVSMDRLARSVADYDFWKTVFKKQGVTIKSCEKKMVSAPVES